MADQYKQRWGGTQPGALIFLLDQSGSMSDKFALAQAGAGRRKCDLVATILNGFLNELVVINTIANADGATVVRPRADIAVLGYEGNTIASTLDVPALKNKDFVTLPELQVNPLDIENRKRKEIDDTGQEMEILVPFPIWVRAKAGGGTPMFAALQRAATLAANWATSHQDNYPPVIVNVTDGMANDGDPVRAAQAIAKITTTDGAALLYNVHVTDINSQPVYYPSSESELPNDTYAKQLFAMSSIIPENSRPQLEQTLKRPVPVGARGMIFNGDAASIRDMFVFASAAATALDPNK
jgi:hypothetical protein